MWLRRFVGIMIVLAFVVMNTLTIWGLVATKKVTQSAIQSSNLSQMQATPAPTITLTAEPTSIAAGTSSALSWTTTGNPTCTASSNIPGPWTGEKTQVGAESTGRLANEGNYTFTLICTNKGGTAEAAATITVGAAAAPQQAVTSKTTPSAAAKTYCGGRIPCYGPKEVASHSSAGNCWGWNGDVVINISGFDTAYHQAKSGIGSIEISQICGKDLGPSLGGGVSAGGQTRNHLQATKSNSSANTAPYFVGYFDSSK
jgi:hypothetical protein